MSFERTKSKPSEAGSILRGKNSRWERSFREPHGNGVKEAGFDDGGLAQLGERLPCKQEVSGSIPLISTRQTKALRVD